MCRTLRKDCCFVLNVLVSPAGTPGRCWAWWLGTNLRAPCVGVWLLSQFATETQVPCWSEELLWVLGVPCERAASMSGSSEAPGRPDPWLPAHRLLSLWRMLSMTFHDLTGSPCAGTVEGGPVHLLQDQTHTQTQLECQTSWKAYPTGSQMCLQCPLFEDYYYYFTEHHFWIVIEPDSIFWINSVGRIEALGFAEGLDGLRLRKI